MPEHGNSLGPTDVQLAFSPALGLLVTRQTCRWMPSLQQPLLMQESLCQVFLKSEKFHHGVSTYDCPQTEPSDQSNLLTRLQH